MTVKHNVALPISKHLFLKLPRELRDLIYAEIFTNCSPPISLHNVQVEPAGLALLAEDKEDLELKPEILEALYTYSEFTIPFSDPKGSENTCSVGGSAHPQYEEHIRKATVIAEEVDLRNATTLEDLETACLTDSNYTRAQWESLLSLSRLEQLTIQLQKTVPDHLFWADFSPIIIQLRRNLPKVNIRFMVSFDTLLERVWCDPIWENYTEPGNVVGLPYEPMGFVDVSELIEPPTEGDFAYVEEHLSHDKSTYGRDIVRGLLDETAPLRRGLALHYVVKDPELLRVRIAEHYEVYKRRSA
ncbi:hypothetical protein E8E13_006425 [Curvularia kusanoi]|uniref:Uncharacterized protein n=1 Tax=Curvularia kusanoi TaxID=90978 RepID=A0A9P4WCL0_CURKU|nr:hypothetical protein E8E13_006425 [Curvularia kusanoi]